MAGVNQRGDDDPMVVPVPVPAAAAAAEPWPDPNTDWEAHMTGMRPLRRCRISMFLEAIIDHLREARNICTQHTPIFEDEETIESTLYRIEQSDQLARAIQIRLTQCDGRAPHFHVDLIKLICTRHGWGFGANLAIGGITGLIAGDFIPPTLADALRKIIEQVKFIQKTIKRRFSHVVQ